MKRRTFIALVGAAAVVPFDVHAASAERVRRLGVLMSTNESDPVA